MNFGVDASIRQGVEVRIIRLLKILLAYIDTKKQKETAIKSVTVFFDKNSYFVALSTFVKLQTAYYD